MQVNSYINEKGQLVTEYIGVKEYEQFLQQRITERGIRIPCKISVGYKQQSEMNLIALKRRYEKNPYQNRKVLKRISEELTRRKIQ